MKIQRLDVFAANIPFRFSFKHAAAERQNSESIFVKITLADGTIGWGEGLPRPYVTGETVSSSLQTTRDALAPLLIGQAIEKTEDVYALAGKISGTYLAGEEAGQIYFGAARCAVEIALLDAASRALKIPFSDWLGHPVRKILYATAIIPEISLSKLPYLLWLVRLTGFRTVKIKVGTEKDEEVLGLVRKILGPRVALIVDANGAWQADEAIEKLSRWKHFDIALVEQPVAARDLAGMRRVREQTGLSVMADESLRSFEDAENLVRAGACSAFNIRLSKCGGLLPSWRIYKFARTAGLGCQLGCQVGETSLLAAAGRCFAACASELLFYEGGYGWLLLRVDPARSHVRLGWGDSVALPTCSRKLGIGSSLHEDSLHPFIAESLTLP